MSCPRLDPTLLSSPPDGPAIPSYDRSAVQSGVVHLGIGAFHRGHQAVVFDDCLRTGDMRWGVIGASLRSPTVAEQLNPQAGLYTLSIRDNAGTNDRIIGAVSRAIVAPAAPEVLLEALAAPSTHLVTLTITEKGYMLDPASGALLADHSDVVHDCDSSNAPRTAPGFLARALGLRRARGLAPLTVISCDNIPANGARLRSAVCQMAASQDADLARWIDEEIAFPQTMVDRIVPATTPEDIEELAERWGYRDLAMIKTEPFLQWVIEDRFSGQRPDFASAGVQLTRSVPAWEQAKLRLLNGAHSTLAYIGGLAGIDHVHQVVARPGTMGLLDGLWGESAATLNPPAELDIAAYRRQLARRFANEALPHKTRQIAMDGSQKLPQRLLEPIAERYQQGLHSDYLMRGVAAWMRWVTAPQDDRGAPIRVDDPMAPALAAIAKRNTTAETIVGGLVSLSEIFPASLADNAHFSARLTELYRDLATHGAEAWING